MTSRASPRSVAPGTNSGAADRLLPAWAAGTLLLLVGLISGAALATTWRAEPSAWVNPRSTPHWLPAESVRATSRDGDIVRARVALDAPDPDTRAWIRSHAGQLELLLQVGVSQFQDDGVGGAQRVQRLGTDIRTHVNTFLSAHHVPPVRDVMIEDLMIRTP